MRAAPRPDAAVATDRLHVPQLEPVRIGMPELCRAGLSETWLFKACGHRHWLALARAHGLAAPDFRDGDGERLYPAFTSVTLTDGALDRAGEDALLDFDLMLIRIGRTRFRSIIRVTADGVPVAIVTMESAFVRRAIHGRNRSATRSMVARPCSLIAPSAGATPPLRPDTWERHAGFVRADRTELATFLIDPSPHEDYNGADFLYFAAFQAMLDRAEWHWFRRADPLLVTAGRRICYAGNAELGDQIIATLCGVVDETDGLSHWIELSRQSDRQTIAIAFSRRRNDVRSADVFAT